MDNIFLKYFLPQRQNIFLFGQNLAHMAIYFATWRWMNVLLMIFWMKTIN
jgi:hypothetical protein